MRQRFTWNLLILLVLNVLVKPLYLLGVEVGVQNAVGDASYGLYYAMLNFTMVFNVLLDMGMSNFQKIRVAQNEAEGMSHMAALLPLKFGMSLLYITVTVIAALFMGYDEEHWFFIGWCIFNQILVAFLMLLRANLSGMHLFFRDSLLSVADRTVLIALVGYFLLTDREAFRIEYFVFAQSAAYLGAIGLALLLTPARVRYFGMRWEWSASRTVLRQTWPFALLILLMTAYSRIDGIMIEQLLVDGAEEAGRYAQAWRLLDAGNNFAFLFAGLLLPLFARMIHGDQGELRSLVEQAARLLIGPSGMALIVVLYQGDWLMTQLYDSVSDSASISLRWLMGSFVFICIGYVYGTLITASEQMRGINILAFISLVLNIALNAWLIPRYGAAGASQASLVALGFMALAQMSWCRVKLQMLALKWLPRVILSWLLLLAIGELGQLIGFTERFQFALITTAALGLFVSILVRKDDFSILKKND